MAARGRSRRRGDSHTELGPRRRLSRGLQQLQPVILHQTQQAHAEWKRLGQDRAAKEDTVRALVSELIGLNPGITPCSRTCSRPRKPTWPIGTGWSNVAPGQAPLRAFPPCGFGPRSRDLKQAAHPLRRPASGPCARRGAVRHWRMVCGESPPHATTRCHPRADPRSAAEHQERNLGSNSCSFSMVSQPFIRGI